MSKKQGRGGRRAGYNAPFEDNVAEASGNLPMCRICYANSEDDPRPLISPCQCAGGMRFVHSECLVSWLYSSALGEAQHRCDICRSELRVRFAAVGAPYGWRYYSRYIDELHDDDDFDGICSLLVMHITILQALPLLFIGFIADASLSSLPFAVAAIEFIFTGALTRKFLLVLLTCFAIVPVALLELASVIFYLFWLSTSAWLCLVDQPWSKRTIIFQEPLVLRWIRLAGLDGLTLGYGCLLNLLFMLSLLWFLPTMSALKSLLSPTVAERLQGMLYLIVAATLLICFIAEGKLLKKALWDRRLVVAEVLPVLRRFDTR